MGMIDLKYILLGILLFLLILIFAILVIVEPVDIFTFYHSVSSIQVSSEELSVLVSTVEAASFIILTTFLVVLYRRQAAISESQKEVQEGQLEISKYEHAPELAITPLGCNLRAHDPYVEFRLENQGNGPIRGLWALTDFKISGKNSEHSLVGKSTYVDAAIPINSTPESRIDFPQKLNPGESINQKIQFRLSVEDINNQETVTDSAPAILGALSNMNTGGVYIRFEIGGRDIFGMDRNPVLGPYRKTYSMHINIDYDEYGSLVNNIEHYIERNSMNV